ncbi:MAG: Hsp20/alpha crystallin family protein [Ignavibacteria bacterium]|nr:Hsp20/alpha crystallin family protein [Ignavibacteria bacterium]
MYCSNMIYQRPQADVQETTYVRIPAVDILESESDVKLTVSMPGVKKEDVKIQYDNGYLVISGSVATPENENAKYILKEIRQGNFHRKFKLGDSIDTEKTEAQYADGILEITLYKKAESQPKTITIK